MMWIASALRSGQAPGGGNIVPYRMPVIAQAQRLAGRKAAGRKRQAAEERSTIGINHGGPSW
jgi:hypothetical protein